MQTGRVKSAVHGLDLLMSLESQMMKNNFKKIFTILCDFYVSCNKFISMLNYIGMCINWDALTKSLHGRMKQYIIH